ncbi:hypothetical protein OBBRIDRAFT_793574 [Obba rivulosa]|uniref:Uncharacterized protein n=1 Tax=Obba rivulosa TaxID=1052685 RepID=A0A8E2B0S6_9APHY|nr:hypothetical protein OBBRIDRAFT_793574 [Obba rivulosa]
MYNHCSRNIRSMRRVCAPSALPVRKERGADSADVLPRVPCAVQRWCAVLVYQGMSAANPSASPSPASARAQLRTLHADRSQVAPCAPNVLFGSSPEAAFVDSCGSHTSGNTRAVLASVRPPPRSPPTVDRHPRVPLHSQRERANCGRLPSQCALHCFLLLAQRASVFAALQHLRTLPKVPRDDSHEGRAGRQNNRRTRLKADGAIEEFQKRQYSKPVPFAHRARWTGQIHRPEPIPSASASRAIPISSAARLAQFWKTSKKQHKPSSNLLR